MAPDSTDHRSLISVGRNPQPLALIPWWLTTLTTGHDTLVIRHPDHCYPLCCGRRTKEHQKRVPLLTLLDAMSLTDRWVWMVSSCSMHQSSSSRVSIASFMYDSSGQRENTHENGCREKYCIQKSNFRVFCREVEMVDRKRDQRDGEKEYGREFEKTK